MYSDEADNQHAHLSDEFNRIDISVLSVVSTQWKCILDAIRAKKARFTFEEEDILLNHEPFCSAYITVSLLCRISVYCC